jgi:hypothetical protein
MIRLIIMILFTRTLFFKNRKPRSLLRNGVSVINTWHHPLHKGFRLVVNLLTMPYLNTLFCAPNSLKSQETNFIDNHLKGSLYVESAGC